MSYCVHRNSDCSSPCLVSASCGRRVPWELSYFKAHSLISWAPPPTAKRRPPLAQSIACTGLSICTVPMCWNIRNAYYYYYYLLKAYSPVNPHRVTSGLFTKLNQILQKLNTIPKKRKKRATHPAGGSLQDLHAVSAAAPSQNHAQVGNKTTTTTRQDKTRQDKTIQAPLTLLVPPRWPCG